MFDFYNGLGKIKWAVTAALIAVGGGLFIAMIIGALCFDIEAISVAPWFTGSVLIVFVLGFICALIFAILCAIFEFFARKPWPALFFIGALLLVFIGIIILWLVKKPAIDLGTYLAPIFSFLK